MKRGFRQLTIRSTFDKVSKRMSLYEYVNVGAVHKSFQKNLTFSIKGHIYIRVSAISVPTALQIAF